MADSVAKQTLDLASQLAEPLLDGHLATGWVREVPIIGSAIQAVRLGTTVSDAILAAKVKRFLDGVGNVSESEVKKFAYEMRRDDSLRSNVGQLVVLAIDRVDELDKAELIGELFRRFLQGRIDLNDLQCLVSAVNRAAAGDLREFLSSVRRDPSVELLRRLMPSGLSDLGRSIEAPLATRGSVKVPLVPQLTEVGTLLRELLGRI